VVQTKGKPQEDQPLQKPIVCLERTIQDQNDHVPGCFAELVFNLDEVGISDWEDRDATKVVVPAAMSDQLVHVSAAGRSLLPSLVTAQNSSTVPEYFRRRGVRFGNGFTWKFNQKPCVNAGIFLHYIRTLFLPYLVRFHDLEAFAR
jgi:hypothetical protein